MHNTLMPPEVYKNLSNRVQKTTFCTGMAGGLQYRNGCGKYVMDLCGQIHVLGLYPPCIMP